MRDVDILSNAWNAQNPDEPPITFVRNDNILKTLAYFTGNAQYLNPIRDQDNPSDTSGNPEDPLSEGDIEDFVSDDNSADNTRY